MTKTAFSEQLYEQLFWDVHRADIDPDRHARFSPAGLICRAQHFALIKTTPEHGNYNFNKPQISRI
ncbi:MAG: hypothetical protein WC959_05835 [Kiritimatiellales bacterium]